jgi:hypothetical protein
MTDQLNKQHLLEGALGLDARTSSIVFLSEGVRRRSYYEEHIRALADEV